MLPWGPTRVKNYISICTKPHCLSLLYICGLLVQARDLHPNPGPILTSTLDFSCGICSHEVHAHHHAIQCDECDCWYHTSCVQINDTTYERLKHNSVLWFCSCCGLPNYSRCLFSSNITTSNKFSTLESLPDSSNHPRPKPYICTKPS